MADDHDNTVILLGLLGLFGLLGFLAFLFAQKNTPKQAQETEPILLAPRYISVEDVKRLRSEYFRK